MIGERMALVLFVWYAGWSVVTFTVFAFDKLAARHDRRRVPERRLHLLEALGGFPGGFLAILFCRHKSRKTGFLVMSMAATLLNLVVLAAVLGLFLEPV